MSAGAKRATVGDIEIAYETFGSPADPPVLLIMGLATQMLAWHEDFCGLLAARGFYTVRFDNRDIGLSTHCSEPACGATASKTSPTTRPGCSLPLASTVRTW